MKTAAVYMRMSTDRQEHSIESQWRLISAYAENHGYTIIKRYEDEGISGKEESINKRAGFLQMIDDSELREWDYVLIYDSSRFSRSLKDSIVYKSILKQNGVQLISITEPVMDEDNALITDAIMGAMNEMYIRKLSKNVRRGQEQKVLRHEVFSKPPFGYRRPAPGSSFEIVPEEAEIIRYIFKAYEEGSTIYGLATKLATANVTTRYGNPFDTRQVEYILTNPIYKGWMRVKLSGVEHYVQADHSPIIEPEYFDEIQEIYHTRQRRKHEKQQPRERRKHWLSGKIRCSQCGGAYFYSKSYGKRNDTFRCSNLSKGKCIKSPSITIPALEQLFFDAILECCNTTERFTLTLEPATPPVKTDYQTAIHKLQVSLARAKKAYLAEVDTLEEYRANKERIEAEIAELEAEQEKSSLPRIPDYSEIRKKLQGLCDLLKSTADLEEKQKAVEDTISCVYIHPNRTISIAILY